jgi:hypothetical protein
MKVIVSCSPSNNAKMHPRTHVGVFEIATVTVDDNGNVLYDLRVPGKELLSHHKIMPLMIRLAEASHEWYVHRSDSGSGSRADRRQAL